VKRPGPGVSRLRVVVGFVLTVLATGCQHAAGPAQGEPVPAVPATGSPREGSVAVEFLADPVSRDEKLDEAHVFVPASLLLMPLPEYPPAALAGGGPSALVGVRLSINASGVVEDVADSPRLAAYTGPFAAELRQAVDAAVRRWRFTSARIQTLGPASPGSAERPVAAARRVPTYLDFAFRFAVVDGKGIVTVGGEKSVAEPSTAPERVR
jgi:hypothetical protein